MIENQFPPGYFRDYLILAGLFAFDGSSQGILTLNCRQTSIAAIGTLTIFRTAKVSVVRALKKISLGDLSGSSHIWSTKAVLDRLGLESKHPHPYSFPKGENTKTSCRLLQFYHTHRCVEMLQVAFQQKGFSQVLLTVFSLARTCVLLPQI